jgi:hypothetical protein
MVSDASYDEADARKLARLMWENPPTAAKAA